MLDNLDDSLNYLASKFFFPLYSSDNPFCSALTTHTHRYKMDFSKQKVFYSNMHNCEILSSNPLSYSLTPTEALLRLQKLMPSTALPLHFLAVSNSSWLDACPHPDTILSRVQLILPFFDLLSQLPCQSHYQIIPPSVCSPPPPGLPRVTEKIE